MEKSRNFVWMKLTIALGGLTSLLILAKEPFTLFGISSEEMAWFGGAAAVIALVVTIVSLATKKNLFKKAWNNCIRFFKWVRHRVIQKIAESESLDSWMNRAKEETKHKERENDKMWESLLKKHVPPPQKSSTMLKSEFAKIERRYREMEVRVNYTDGHTDIKPGQAGLQYIVHDLRDGLTGLMLMEHKAQLIEFKRILRSLSVVKRELLNNESLGVEGNALLTDINDFYRSSFEAYVYPIIRAYQKGSDSDEAKDWKLADVPFRDVVANSRTRPRGIGQTTNPPHVNILRMDKGEVFSSGTIRVRISNPQDHSALLFEGLSVNDEDKNVLPYSMDFDVRKLAEPRWVEPGNGFTLTMYVKDLRHDKRANKLIHIFAAFDEIGPIKSNEEAVPANMVTN